MELIRDPGEMRDLSRTWRAGGLRLGFVPTMGALHEGHLSLLRIARERADRVVASIFVNPTQFGPGEDYARYPRTERADLAACESEGADAVFLPAAADMYGEGSCTFVTVEGSLTAGLCGASRPGHFRGVATVVAKLFHIVEPDLAVFGQKDAQQLAVIRRMVRDLDLPVEVVAAPIAREPDGLAMSSRNAYLTREERAQATVLRAALLEAESLADAGERSAPRLREAMARTVAGASLARLEYAEVVDAETLARLESLDRPALAALAVRFGATRLIDNAQLRPASGGGA